MQYNTHTNTINCTKIQKHGRHSSVNGLKSVKGNKITLRFFFNYAKPNTIETKRQ